MKIILALITALILSTSAWANVPNATPLFNQYTCNSSTTQFPYSFQITASSDMTVYLTDTSGNTTQLSNSVFSVDTTNLWVNYPLVGLPCTTNYTITLRPSTPQTQTTTYGARTPFTATAVGASFDKLTLISQQLQGQINRTFLQPANVTTQVTFPSSNAGYLIGWDSSGNLNNINNPSAVAQWTLSGANIFYNTGNISTTKTFTAANILSTGNVGINSVTPGQALDVQGTVRATSFSGALIGNVTGNVSGTAATVATAAQPNITSVGTLTSLLVSGNVGINSTSPSQALDVVGTVRATSFSSSFIGSPVSRSVGSIYQASTDGIVEATSTRANSVNLIGITDSSSTPSTIRVNQRVADTNTDFVAITFMVRKNDYYEVTNGVDGAGTSTEFFYALGS